MSRLPTVLCVDDEENVLHGLTRQLRGRADITVSANPLEAVDLVNHASEPFAVIVSDMRMPVMDGAELLARVAEDSPDTTRVLLTGQADITSAIAAVNRGRIFRFLLKPCPSDEFVAAVLAAAEQHRLVTAERELIEKTVRGSIEALVETLAMAQPAAFTRATRLRRLTADLAKQLALDEPLWVELAAQLGEIGVITLPPDAMEALDRGDYSNPVIAEMLERLPMIAVDLLQRIPRLEPICDIIAAQLPVDRPTHRLPTRDDHVTDAIVLQIAREYDALKSRGHSRAEALAYVSSRYTQPELVAALTAVTSGSEDVRPRAVRVTELRPGQVLYEDLCSHKGSLLVAKDHMLTGPLIQRLRNYAATVGLATDPVIIDPPEV